MYLRGQPALHAISCGAFLFLPPEKCCDGGLTVVGYLCLSLRLMEVMTMALTCEPVAAPTIYRRTTH